MQTKDKLMLTSYLIKDDTPLTIANNHDKIVETNYFDIEMAEQGIFRLSFNANVGRLLVPDCHKAEILRELKKTDHVVMSMGAMSGLDMAELMFEDWSDSPFSIHMGRDTIDRNIEPGRHETRLAIYFSDGEHDTEYDMYIRTVESLPCLLPWAQPKPVTAQPKPQKRKSGPALNIMIMMDHSNKGVGTWDIDFTGIQPFVFDAIHSTDEQIELPDDDVKVLASPFQTFSLEMADGALSAEDDFNIMCIYCHEITVGSYHIVMQVVQNNIAKYFSFTPGITDVNEDVVAHTMKIIRALLGRLQTSKHGLVNYPGKSKFKTSSGQKSVYKPTNIIYVGGGRNSIEPTHTHGGHNIHWQTSWAVMAHWRRLKNPESMGLGRQGKRNVKGYTWVNNYSKGDGALKMKIHRVK